MSLTGQIFEQYQAEFIERCQQVENGDLSPLGVAVEFKKEMDFLNQLADERKSWLNENVDAITDEAESYGKQGYCGLVFTKQTKATASYKHIPAWIEAEKTKKEIEVKSKTAWMMVQKGGLNVDENGEEIPLPEYTYSSFIKSEKAK